MLLFIDESGQDHSVMPYEVLAGVSIAEENLWNLVKAIRSVEKEHFGDYLRNLRATEIKARKLLKKKTFRLANQSVIVEESQRSTLANSFLRKGMASHRKGVSFSPVTAEEMTAYARSVINFIDNVLDIAADFGVQVFASVVDVEMAKRDQGVLEKDFLCLFERYFYCLKGLGGKERGLVIFDEIEKSKAQNLIQQMASYFLGTRMGRSQSSRIIPEPFFVHSELTTGVFLADLAAYIIGWGWRLERMKHPSRKELEPLAGKLDSMQYEYTVPAKKGIDANVLHGITYIDSFGGAASGHCGAGQ